MFGIDGLYLFVVFFFVFLVFLSILLLPSLLDYRNIIFGIGYDGIGGAIVTGNVFKRRMVSRPPGTPRTVTSVIPQ